MGLWVLGCFWCRSAIEYLLPSGWFFMIWEADIALEKWDWPKLISEGAVFCEGFGILGPGRGVNVNFGSLGENNL